LAASLGRDTDLVEVTLPDDRELKIELHLQPSFDVELPIDFDLSTLNLAGASGLLDLEGKAKFDVHVGADLKLDLGIDLSNPDRPRFFLLRYDSRFRRGQAASGG